MAIASGVVNREGMCGTLTPFSQASLIKNEFMCGEKRIVGKLLVYILTGLKSSLLSQAERTFYALGDSVSIMETRNKDLKSRFIKMNNRSDRRLSDLKSCWWDKQVREHNLPP